LLLINIFALQLGKKTYFYQGGKAITLFYDLRLNFYYILKMTVGIKGLNYQAQIVEEEEESLC